MPHVVALLSLLLVVAGLKLAGAVVNQTTVALVLLLPVLMTATRAGVLPAVTAAVGGVLAFNFFFLPPVGTLTITDPLNWVALLVFLSVAVAAGNLFGRARDRAREAERLFHELQTAGAAAARAEALRE